MAKYQVTFSCGHTSEIQLFGKHADRYRKIEWFEKEGLCPACYAAEKARKLQDKAAVFGQLPDLVGTDKQVDWAEDIRIKALADIAEFFAGRADSDKALDYLRRGLQHLTKAAWWIDHRDLDTILMAKAIAQAPVNEEVG